MSPARWLQDRWFAPSLSPALFPWLPVSALFAALSAVRRQLYRRSWLHRERLPVPVLVVGNVTVGGTGKTPLTLWLARELQRRGRRPGIVSRGYGAASGQPRPVAREADPAEVGDEPLLLARKSALPVWVGRDRAAAARSLLAAHPDTDLILCDDGLQHYRLERDAEVAVFDSRGAGNGWRLPAGPLREPLARLRTVDALVFNGAQDAAVRRVAPAVPAFAMQLQPGRFYRLDDPAVTCAAADLGSRPLHALGGIGNPGRFFATLKELGLNFAGHPFPDHHAYTAADLDFGSGAVLLMTEKDAVKCRRLIAGEAWVLPVDAELDPAIIEVLLEKICGRQTS